MINDKLSHQLYETIYPVVVKHDSGGMYTAWQKFVQQSLDARKFIANDGVPSVAEFIDQDLRLNYEGAFYGQFADVKVRFKSEAAVTMFLLRFS